MIEGITIKKPSKREFEKYLNEIEPQPDAFWRCPVVGKFGTWLRKNDKIAFEVEYGRWSIKKIYGGGK